jgi:hypothetical protein
MNEREPSHEWLSSSDWDSIVSWDGGYVLGVGYCYISQLASFFKTKELRYNFFETKWGRCGTTFLFSALRPDSIIVLSAWGNAASICGTSVTLFRIWRSIMLDLTRIGVPIMMVEMPAAWHLSNLAVKVGGDLEERVASMRKSYFEEVINPVAKSIEYVDLMGHVSMDSRIIRENCDGTTRDESPWHIRQEVIDCIGENFIDFIGNKYDKNKMIKEIVNLGDRL